MVYGDLGRQELLVAEAMEENVDKGRVGMCGNGNHKRFNLIARLILQLMASYSQRQIKSVVVK